MKSNLPAKSCFPGSQLGYTLAELAVAVALVGILFVALYGGMSSGFAVTQVTRENLRATQIMLERVEGVRLYNWDQLVCSNMIPTTFTEYYYPLADTNNGESLGIRYTGSMEVNPMALNPAATYSNNMRIILVTVNWTSAGVPRFRSMSTYVARNGVQNYVYSTNSFIVGTNVYFSYGY